MTKVLGNSVMQMRSLLSAVVDTSWVVPAGDVEWSCRDTAAHVADDLFSYASQMIAEPQDNYLPIDAVIDPNATNRQILDAIAMCGRMLELAVENARPEATGWPPMECRTAPGSLQWVPSRSLSTPMTWPVACVWNGSRPRPCARHYWIGSSPTHPPVIPLPCFSTAAVEHPWANALG